MNTGPNLAVVASTLVLMALPWLAAVLLVRRLWRSPEVPCPQDAPARLLRVAIAAQPPHRRDWALAMSAELAAIAGRGERWRFTLGCSWALARTAVGVGVPATLLLGAGFLVNSRLRLGSDGIGDYLFFACVTIGFAVGALATLVDRAFPAGVLAGLGTALLGSLMVAILWVPEAAHWYADGQLLLDGEGGKNPYPFAHNLWDGATTIAVLPLWILPFAVFGAAAANAIRRSSRT
jgi:hypothetical protein